MESPLTDGELARAIAAADGEEGNAALELESELCRRFMNRARVYGLKHLRFDVTLAEDLAQEVMMVVLAALRGGKVEDLEHIDRFMLGTCRNVAHAMRRRAKKTTETGLRLSRELGNITTPPWEGVVTRRVEECLQRLSSKDGRVLSLIVQEGATAQEAAEVLDTTPGNVRVMHHRAISRLRLCVESTEPAKP